MILTCLHFVSFVHILQHVWRQSWVHPQRGQWWQQRPRWRRWQRNACWKINWSSIGGVFFQLWGGFQYTYASIRSFNEATSLVHYTICFGHTHNPRKWAVKQTLQSRLTTISSLTTPSFSYLPIESAFINIIYFFFFLWQGERIFHQHKADNCLLPHRYTIFKRRLHARSAVSALFSFLSPKIGHFRFFSTASAAPPLKQNF